jgi:hypothetical protein
MSDVVWSMVLGFAGAVVGLSLWWGFHRSVHHNEPEEYERRQTPLVFSRWNRERGMWEEDE